MAGVTTSQFIRPTLPNGEPSPYLPGSFVRDPQYQQKLDAWNTQRAQSAATTNRISQERNQGPAAALEAVRRGQAMGIGGTSTYRDPITGQVYTYSSGGSAGGSGAGGGNLEDFDFSRALSTIQPALPPTPGPAQLPARVVGSTPADSAAAQAAEFGRAKDRIGKLGRGSMTALQEEFSARGLGGSNMEGASTQQLLSDLQGQEGEVVRDQAIQNLVRQRQVEDRNYAGDINQRGQDIGFTTTTRGQDMNFATERARLQVPLLQLIAENRKRRLY